LREVYSSIGGSSFSQEVLSAQPNGLAVLRATGLGWSDLGEPGRVRCALERKGIQPERRFHNDFRDADAGLAGKKAAGY
jgi:hypothetical protein